MIYTFTITIEEYKMVNSEEIDEEEVIQVCYI